MAKRADRPRALFLGRTTLDALYRLKRLPEEDTKVFAEGFQAEPGGPATNAARTHRRLGGESLLISAVGKGIWADAARSAFRRSGIRLLDLAAESEYETPLVTVLSAAEQGSRTCVNPPLATTTLPTLRGEWRSAVPAEWGEAPTVALTDGFHLRETLSLLATLREMGTAICLDGGSWKPGTEQLAPLLRTAICSERFRIPESGERGSQAEEVFAWFAERGVREVAISRGPRPILVCEEGRRYEIAIEAVPAAETLGAGDVLHGAFSFYRARGESFESALREAAQVATASCKSTGIDLR